jgi:hypothetical protein
MIWVVWLVVCVVAGYASFRVASVLYERRHPQLPPVYVIMQLDILDNTREIWTIYDTREEAEAAIRLLHDVYARERALEALVTRYGPGYSARPR